MSPTFNCESLGANVIHSNVVDGCDATFYSISITNGEVEVKKLPLLSINYEIHTGISFESSEVEQGCRVIIPNLFKSLTFYVADDGITYYGDGVWTVVFASLVVIHTLYAVPHFAIGQ